MIVTWSTPLARVLLVCLFLACITGCGETIPDVEGIEVELSDATFDEHLSSSSVPVLVDFGASWCGPCRQMKPAVAYLSVQYEDRLSVATVDIDESPDVAAEHDIRGYPTFVIFQDGEEVDRSVGSMSYRSLSSWVDAYAGN